MLALVPFALFGGCGPRDSGTLDAPTEITVLAASSLRDPIEKFLAEQHAANPSVRVRASYAGSQELLAQILAGAPGDVFLCAGTKHLTDALQNGVLDGVGRPFALNQLAIAYRSDLDPPLREIADLGRANLRVVLAAEDVPVGRETRKFLTALEKESPDLPGLIWKNVRSFEASDLAQVAKVRLGEADAAVVYASDLKNQTGLASLAIPDSLNSIQIYFAAPLKRSKSPAQARAFVEDLLGERGRNALNDAGFEVPPAKPSPNEG